MPWDPLSDTTMHLLEKTLNWRSRAQEVIAGNLANLETPNYNRKEVNFQQTLKTAVQGREGVKLTISHERHLPGSRAAAGLVRETDQPVDLDQEMVQLSQNQLGYQTSVTMLTKKLDQLRTVIEGDRR